LAPPPVPAVGPAPGGVRGGGDASWLFELRGEAGRPAVAGVTAVPFPADDVPDVVTGPVEGTPVPAGPGLVVGGGELCGSGPGAWDELGVDLAASSVGDVPGC
jgi:hypothetical protein